jgi:hypothetical protein
MKRRWRTALIVVFACRVAVDTTEQTAAKNALQLAAAELAERLGPKLVK